MRQTSISLTLGLSLLAGAAHAETFEVRMLNGNEHGSMIYEPEHLIIEPGDTVKFKAAVKGHNAATIDGFIPPGGRAVQRQD